MWNPVISAPSTTLPNLLLPLATSGDQVHGRDPALASHSVPASRKSHTLQTGKDRSTRARRVL